MIENKKHGFCNIVMWVDKRHEELQKESVRVFPISAIKEVEYDYILIAVEQLEFANQIRKELIQYGIPKNFIMWNGINSIELVE